VRKNRRYNSAVPVITKKFLILEPMSVSDRWNAQRDALAAEVLRGGGRLRLRVHGESMLPTLWPGHVAEIQACSIADAAAGDIVFAVRDSRFFLHRLQASTASQTFVTRGDSMPGPDPEFAADAFLGKLVSVTRAGSPVSTVAGRWSRALGFVFCHWNLARRMALRFRGARDFQPSTGANVETA
jgi:hypothetical protein